MYGFLMIFQYKHKIQLNYSIRMGRIPAWASSDMCKPSVKGRLLMHMLCGKAIRKVDKGKRLVLQ